MMEEITIDILAGATGPKTDIVLLNAGAAIYAGGKAASIQDGIALARQMIKTGAAQEKLVEFRALSNA